MRIAFITLFLVFSPVDAATIGKVAEDCVGLRDAISLGQLDTDSIPKLRQDYMFCYGYLLGVYDQRKALCESLQINEYRDGFVEGRGLELIAGFNGSSYAEYNVESFVTNFLDWFKENNDKADEQIVAYSWDIFPKCNLGRR